MVCNHKFTGKRENQVLPPVFSLLDSILPVRFCAIWFLKDIKSQVFTNIHIAHCM